MNHRPLSTPRSLAVALTLGVATVFVAVAHAGEKIPFADAPEAVRQAVEREVGRAVRTLEIEPFDGQQAYEAEFERDDVDHAIWVAEDGTVLGRSVEIRVRELPQPVVDAVLAKYPDADIEDAERITMATASATDEPETRYEVEIEVEGPDGRDIDRELIVTADGTILSDELD